MFLIDNINLHRGRKRHFRLSKSKSRNFTVRAAIILAVSDIIDLMTEKETTTMPQSEMSNCLYAIVVLHIYLYASFINVHAEGDICLQCHYTQSLFNASNLKQMTRSF